MGLATALREYYYGTMPVEDGVRKGVESWKEQELARDDLFEEEIEAIHQVGADAEQIAIRALRKLPIDEWETVMDPAGIPMIEYHFTIPLKGWGGFHGYIDWVGRHKPTGQIWLVDWKVRGSFQPYEAEEVNLQNARLKLFICLSIYESAKSLHLSRHSVTAKSSGFIFVCLVTCCSMGKPWVSHPGT